MTKWDGRAAAFPQALDKDREFVGSEGMSLRDYFAGHALFGLACRMNSDVVRKYREGLHDGHEAAVAYALADAMLAERAK